MWSESTSDRVDNDEVEVAVLGSFWMSGALYESMFVVWTNSTGPDILLRMGPEIDPLTELLRLGLPSASPPPPKTLARRVVNALARDIVAEFDVLGSRR